MIAICTMLRKPFNFETWLDYHLSLDVDYIFLRVEETPELSNLLNKYNDKVIVEYDNNVNKRDNYWSQMDRQKKFVNGVISKCKELSVNWLLHIDSDELIWCSKPIREIVSSVNKDVDNISIKNYEAVYPSDSLSNPFLETNTFIQKGLLAYANGKSIGRISNKLYSNGPHLFTGKNFNIGQNLLAILHFESPTFESWYKKFLEEKSDISKEMLDKIPFKFYKESISVIRSGDKIKCKEFYNKMKVEPYNKEGVLKLFWTPMLEQKNSHWTR